MTDEEKAAADKEAAAEAAKVLAERKAAAAKEAATARALTMEDLAAVETGLRAEFLAAPKKGAAVEKGGGMLGVIVGAVVALVLVVGLAVAYVFRLRRGAPRA